MRTIKILVVGSSQSGKSSLISNYYSAQEKLTNSSIQLVDHCTKSVSIGGYELLIEIRELDDKQPINLSIFVPNHPSRL